MNLNLSAGTIFGVVLLAILITITVVTVVKKKKAKSTLTVADILEEIRDDFFPRFNKYDTFYESVVKAEKEGGRDAAKKAIENIITDYLSGLSIITKYKMDFILDNVDEAVDFVEKELVKMGILEKAEVVIKPQLDKPAGPLPNATAAVTTPDAVAPTQNPPAEDNKTDNVQK